MPGKIFPLVFLLFCSLNSLQAQEPPCEAPPACNKLRVEIVRVANDVQTNCASSAYDCGDKLHQIVYKVYLKYKTSPTQTPAGDFYLDYRQLDVAVKLKKTTARIFSHIDVKTTMTCYMTGSNTSAWYNYSTTTGDKVVFTPTDESVAISFSNYDAGATNCGNAPGNKIKFTWGTPSGNTPCGSSTDYCA